MAENEVEELLIAIALIWHGGELLIARRNPGSHQALKWEFPGGKVENGESAEAAVLREVLEETAMSVELLGERRAILHSYPERRVTIRVFDCRAS
ncbi:MAG: NUDIX domain-containing protein, partial [Myxococcales bacterium]|nr:NUDIX domain-containing protein [Myxococcales bacterium]